MMQRRDERSAWQSRVIWPSGTGQPEVNYGVTTEPGRPLFPYLKYEMPGPRISQFGQSVSITGTGKSVSGLAPRMAFSCAKIIKFAKSFQRLTCWPCFHGMEYCGVQLKATACTSIFTIKTLRSASIPNRDWHLNRFSLSLLMRAEF